MRSVLCCAISMLVVLCLPNVADTDDLAENSTDLQGGMYKWIALPDYSSIQFRTSHWGILDIVGWFEDFEVTLLSDTLSWIDSGIEVRVRTESVRMPNSEMAENLRGMFEVGRYPEAIFQASEIRFVSEDSIVVEGSLKLRDITSPVTLTGRLNGYAFPPDGMPGLTLSGEIIRFQFSFGDSTRSAISGKFDLGETIFVTCNVRLLYAGRVESQQE